VVLIGLGAAYSVAASITRPFTDGADIVVSLALLAGVLVLTGPRSLASVAPVLDRHRAVSSSDPATRRWLPWATAAGVTAGWELFCLFSLPRSTHPTISSMLDAADGSHLGRGIAFAAWLALGWYVVTR
jgi:hypothetical protein